MIGDGRGRIAGRPAACWLAAALALACGRLDVGSEPRPVVVQVPRPSLADGVFPRVEPDITEGPVPARFSRELPASIAEYEASWADYPAAHVGRGLCAGDAEIVGRFQKAIDAAVAGGDDPAEVRDAFGHLLEWCDRPEQCEWAAAAVEAGNDAAGLAWVALAQCPGGAVQTLFEQGGAPAAVLIEYWAGRSWREDYAPSWNPSLVAALREVARAGDPWNTRSAAVLVSEMDGPAAETLLALYDDLPAGETRDQIVPSFSDMTHPRARELFAEYCRREGETDAVCQSDFSPLAGLPELTPRPATDASDCLAREGLRDLLTGGDVDAGFETAGCLSALAAVDRAAAVDQARTVMSWDLGDTELGNLVQWIDAFPAAGQLETELRDVGLLPRGPLPGAEYWQEHQLDLTPGEVLARAGPVICFDLETGQFPNQHDRLLYDLAELAGPPLSDAVFEEEAPAFELADGGWWVAGRRVDQPPPGTVEGLPYRLRAYLGGRIYETEAQDYGDWYDLDRVLGLLNAMAADQGAAARAVSLPAGGQDACVLAAPREAVVAGIEAGLLQVSAGGATERARERERQVLEQLIEQEGFEQLIAEPEKLLTPD